MSNILTPPPGGLWMRAVSFAGLHRVLTAVGAAPNGLRAKDINDLVLEQKITLTRRVSQPKPTTLYHYRNTLLRLHALKRHGQRLRANVNNPNVRALLLEDAPANDDQSLSEAAREHFAALVLSNDHCRMLFFDLFLPSDKNTASVSDFREHGDPISWTREMPSRYSAVIFENTKTGRKVRHLSESVPAILYGLRYWARNELSLVDEYNNRADNSTIMFPISNPSSSPEAHNSAVLHAVHFMLDQRTFREWTLFSIAGLIGDYCQTHRQPRAVLFDAIDWLSREWPHHIILIPTSLSLATLSATSPQQRRLVLRRYYKRSHGPYISHIRVHKDIPNNSTDAVARHGSDA